MSTHRSIALACAIGMGLGAPGLGQGHDRQPGGAAAERIATAPAPAPAPRVYLKSARDGDPLVEAAAGSLVPRLGSSGSILRRAAGVNRVGGELVGGGPDYEVRFDRRGFEFVPALGSRARRTFALRFELESYGRRHGGVARVGLAEPLLDGRTVRYTRPGIVESYETRSEGVEQSFTFDALPPGAGALIVRGRLATELPLASATADGVRFESTGLGGVTIGKVVGIDARGERADGALRFDRGTLELSLPGDFVARAALPLVLDPLVGAAFNPASGFDDEDPDVAYDATNDEYLVVWQRVFGAASVGIRAQRVDSAGGLLGSFLTIRSAAFNATRPRVANVNLRDAFLVVWAEDNDIVGTSVAAGGGAVGSAITIAAEAATPSEHDIGGEAATTDDDAIVVWAAGTTARAAQFQMSSTGTLSAFGTTDISSGGSFMTSIAISSNGGASGRHLVSWNWGFAGRGFIEAAVVDRNLGVLDVISMAPISSWEGNPAVDGDGTCWVVAYEAEEALGGPFPFDIACRGVCFDPASGSAYLSPAVVIVEGDVNDDEKNPSVAWMGGSALIGYADEVAAPDYDAYIKSVDPFSCLSCEGESIFESGARDADFVMIASQASAGASGEEALIVWESTDTATAESDLVARRYRADDGRVTDLGGGCGLGGAAYATCAVIGNGAYAMRVLHAEPLKRAYLVISPARLDLPCGACTIVPDPFVGFVANAGNTDAHGDAAVSVALPNDPSLIGVTFLQQWWVDASAGSCVGFDLSNALEVEIQ